MSKQTKQNDPNVNFGMYEKDREAKREAQTATGAGTLPRVEVAEVYSVRRPTLFELDAAACVMLPEEYNAWVDACAEALANGNANRTSV